jgi:DNA-binding MarR family transcriptional regulator
MAALLKRMERDRLISRKPDPSDSRAQLVALTSRARSAVANAKETMTKVVDEALAGVSEPDQRRLVELLQIIVRNLSDDPSNLTDYTVT